MGWLERSQLCLHREHVVATEGWLHSIERPLDHRIIPWFKQSSRWKYNPTYQQLWNHNHQLYTDIWLVTQVIHIYIYIYIIYYKYFILYILYYILYILYYIYIMIYIYTYIRYIFVCQTFGKENPWAPRSRRSFPRASPLPRCAGTPRWSPGEIPSTAATAAPAVQCPWGDRWWGASLTLW